MLLRVLASLTAAGLLSGCGLFDSYFVSACEEALMDRLRSPATYQRIELDEFEEKLTALEYSTENSLRSQIGREADEAAINSGRWKARRLNAIITYDAENAYGTPVRSKALCQYVTVQDSPKPFKQAVKIDGTTSIDYLQDALRKAN